MPNGSQGNDDMTTKATVLDDQAIRVRLLRLALLFGGEVAAKDLKPEIDKSTRERLESRGLIERDCYIMAANGRKVRGLRLTDSGWMWLCDHFAGDVRSNVQCGRELTAVLHLLRKLSQEKNLTFSELLTRYRSSSAANGDLSDAMLEERLPAQVRHVCQKLQKHLRTDRLRLTHIRRELGSVANDVLNKTLLAMDSRGEVTLYQMDDPLEITAEDRAAALMTPSGQARHILYLRQAP